MKFVYNPNERLIVVEGVVYSASDSHNVRLAIDTGASVTLISQNILSYLGYSFFKAPKHSFSTGSKLESAPEIQLLKFEILGLTVTHFKVLAYNLPATTNIHGVIGLDFLKPNYLEFHFKNRWVQLSPPVYYFENSSEREKLLETENAHLRQKLSEQDEKLSALAEQIAQLKAALEK